MALRAVSRIVGSSSRSDWLFQYLEQYPLADAAHAHMMTELEHALQALCQRIQ
jgi:hypothetical protein